MKNQNRKRVFIALLTSTMVLYPSISAYAMDPERERSHSSSAPHKLHNNNNFTSPSEKNSWEKITRTPQQLGLKMTQEKFEEAITFDNDLKKAINFYNEQAPGIFDASKGKDIIVAIGNTGAGKSTLLNLLVGNSLKVNETSLGYELYDKENAKSFKIGLTDKSETLLPQCIEGNIQGKTHLFFDLPGLCDTRGAATAFLNATCIKDILTKAQSVRFIFVEGQGSFETIRGEAFKNLLLTTLKLLPDSETLKGSSAFVVTQTRTLDPEFLIQFIKKKIDKDFIEGVEKIFSLEKPFSIFSFLHPSEFIKEDRKTRSRKLDAEDARETLSNIKTDVEKGVHDLKGINIPKINQTVLLNKGTDELLNRLFKILAAESWQASYPSLEDLDLGGLARLKSNLKETVKESFQRKLNSISEIGFIRAFDDSLYNTQLNESFVDIDKNIELLGAEIDKKILEKQKFQAEKKQEEAEQKVQELEKETKEIAEKIKNEKNEEARKALEKQEMDFNTILVSTLKTVQDEKDKIGKIVEKEKELREEKEKVKQARKSLRETKDFRDICRNIDSLFNNLNDARRKLDEEIDYQKTRSTFGTFFKGLISIGLHTAYHHNREIELQRDYNSIKSKLREQLNKYETMMIGERHTRHDEI